MSHWLDKVVSLLQAETADLRELAQIAGGDPRIFYRGINPAELDLANQDIQGMEFSSTIDQSTHIGQLELQLLSEADQQTARNTVIRIKTARRQEERAALLLAEFLRDRSHALQIIDSYVKDDAQVTHSVLSVLREVHFREMEGKRFTNLQIARKVSGRFRRAEDKRSLVAYFFAKHLREFPELRPWLRTKSLARLSGEQQDEFNRFLE